MNVSLERRNAFRALVRNFYKKHGRHTLPWRKTRDPYHILVSEIMLQQTQVDRVIPYFTAWLTLFPDVHALAKAPLGKVLRAWQGLGYNRRGKMLHETAKRVVKEYGGVFPQTREALEALPGIGAYTAGAVSAFAYNQDVVFVETNIRTAITHHFFPDRKEVDDAHVRTVLEKVLPKGGAHEWYSALMDYGAHLKKTGVRLNSRAKGYVPQKKFQGSGREARGAILKALAVEPKNKNVLLGLLGTGRAGQVADQLKVLAKEGLVVIKKRKYQLPE